MNPTSLHIPVLTKEILELGQPRAGQTWIDGTAGGGGHARLIADCLGANGRLLAIDRDPAAIAALKQVLGPHREPPVEPTSHETRPETPSEPLVELLNASYDLAPEWIAQKGWPAVDGMLLDLGLSSDQLADRERGFSFQAEGPLDMRFDPTYGEPAWEWLARVEEQTLADTIYRYGEERFSRRIARRVVETRKLHPIRTASELRELIYQSVPRTKPKGTKPKGSKQRGGKGKGPWNQKHKMIDPATRTFQALRIAVNDELSILERALQRLPDCLAEGGYLLVISFHSLEDRMVKYAFRQDERLEIVTRRPVQASDSEIAANPRSRSAKLRVARRKP